MPKPGVSRQVLDELFRLIRSDQFEQAKQKCDSLLSIHPRDVNILSLYGAILLKLGSVDDAQRFLEQAIALEPEFAKPHEDLGRLFLLRKEPGQAVHYFSRAIALDDSQASAYGGLATGLAQLEKTEEANAAHQQFLKRSPVAGKLFEADQLLRDGDPMAADRLCNELLRREPENTQILRMLARIASVDGRVAVAEALLRRISKLSPGEYLPHTDLGRFLTEQSRYSEAIESFEYAVSLNSDLAENFCLLGDALAVIGKSEEALASYEQALALHPEDPRAMAGKGHMLRVAGNADKAVAAYEECTRLKADFGDAWWALASLKGYQLSDSQQDTIRGQIKLGNLRVESEIGMRFALARASEAAGDFDAAWQDYSLGNSLKRKLVTYDPVHTEVTHDAIISQFTCEFLDRVSPDRASPQTPIFILGMPRSGSTLLEQILASHSTVEGLGELPYVAMLSATLGGQRPGGLRYPEVVAELTEAQLDSLGKAYLYQSGAQRRLGLPCFTDKMPANFVHVGLIHLMLPDAKIIDARRHPLATCVSNFRQLYAEGKSQTYDLDEFAEYYLEYCRVMDHWEGVLPGRVLRVQYEEVVADLDGQVRRMLDYCELPWEDSCLDFHRNTRPVNTASAEQVRDPIYTDAVDFWKNYETFLEPVRKILTPVMPFKTDRP